MLNGTKFTLQFNSNWFRQNDLISVGNVSLKVIEKPYRKWYQCLFEFLSFGLYKAPWYYKVERYY